MEADDTWIQGRIEHVLQFLKSEVKMDPRSNYLTFDFSAETGVTVFSGYPEFTFRITFFYHHGFSGIVYDFIKTLWQIVLYFFQTFLQF